MSPPGWGDHSHRALLFLSARAATWTGIVISMLAHFLVGGRRAIFTSRPALPSGLEMFLVGLGVAGVTYLVGRLFGVDG